MLDQQKAAAEAAAAAAASSAAASSAAAAATEPQASGTAVTETAKITNSAGRDQAAGADGGEPGDLQRARGRRDHPRRHEAQRGRSGRPPVGQGAGLHGAVGDTALGNAIVQYHIDHWDELGVEYIIYKQRILQSPNGSWSTMEDRGSPTANHMDHVHVNYR